MANNPAGLRSEALQARRRELTLELYRAKARVRNFIASLPPLGAQATKPWPQPGPSKPEPTVETDYETQPSRPTTDVFKDDSMATRPPPEALRMRLPGPHRIRLVRPGHIRAKPILSPCREWSPTISRRRDYLLPEHLRGGDSDSRYMQLPEINRRHGLAVADEMSLIARDFENGVQDEAPVRESYPDPDVDEALGLAMEQAYFRERGLPEKIVEQLFDDPSLNDRMTSEALEEKKEKMRAARRTSGIAYRREVVPEQPPISVTHGDWDLRLRQGAERRAQRQRQQEEEAELQSAPIPEEPTLIGSIMEDVTSTLSWIWNGVRRAVWG